MIEDEARGEEDEVETRGVGGETVTLGRGEETSTAEEERSRGESAAEVDERSDATEGEVPPPC